MRARAFSLVEVAISVVIVGGLFAAALNVAGSAGVTRRKVTDVGRAYLLAEDLMAEIIAQPYREPGTTSSPIGPETGETTGGTRAAFDDVDDYAGWKDSPPAARDGTAIAGYSDWARTVAVAWAPANDLTATSGTATGLKRITVTVSRAGTKLFELTAIRTSATDAAWAYPFDGAATPGAVTEITSFGSLP